MYQLTADPANHRIEVDFIGNYADIDRAKLTRELRAAALRVKGGSDHFDLLMDSIRMSVMPQSMTPDAREEMEWCIANGLRRSASVTTSAIAKMQIARLSVDQRFRTFTSRAEALAWLDEPDWVSAPILPRGPIGQTGGGTA